MVAGCLIFLLLLAPSAAVNGESPTVAPVNQGESSKAKPKVDSVKKTMDSFVSPEHLQALVQQGRYREATDQYEQASSADHRLYPNWMAWDLAQAYVKQGRYEKAIDIYKLQYHFITESIEQRVDLGELLLLGEVGARPETTPVGKGQCPLCHSFTKGSSRYDWDHPLCGPNLRGIAQRAKRLINAPEYLQRPQDTEQPEAFPGSGRASSVIEYLAESNVCPSCYVVPGYINWPDSQGRDSRMPRIHKPTTSLTIDEMVAIDTWLLKQEGEEIPSVAVMRAAYEKFLRPEDRQPPYEGIRLAALYDAKGDLAEAIRLLDATYQAMLPSQVSWELAELERLRDDPQAFRNLKQRSDIVAKFPKLLQVGRP